jgi:hypothetical protein
MTWSLPSAVCSGDVRKKGVRRGTHRDTLTRSPEPSTHPTYGNVRGSEKTLGWLVTRDGARHL